MTNQKYEITDIVHGEYPFLHRIRALRNIGKDVKAGDLGGFVEHEGNLSFESGDDAWIYDDAVSAGDAHVDMGSVLRVRAVACDHAYASHGSVLFGDARAEDDAYIRGATLFGSARVSGQSMILNSADDPNRAPKLSGSCCVYGKVTGSVHILGDTVVISGEEVCNSSQDMILIDGKSRTVVRDPGRDVLRPRQPENAEEKAGAQGGGQMNPNNQKYEITDIAHPEYPFLHRIRALRDIGPTVKAGDLGGFVEGECNLSYEDKDSWIAHDAIAANGAFVTDARFVP